MVFKIKQEGKPRYLHEKVSKSFNYETRLAKTNAMRKTEKNWIGLQKAIIHTQLKESEEQPAGQAKKSD